MVEIIKLILINISDLIFCKPHFTLLYNVAGDYTTGFQPEKIQELREKEEREKSHVRASMASDYGPILDDEQLPAQSSISRSSNALNSDDQSDLQRRKTVRDRTSVYETKETRARAEDNGELLPEDYDENGNVKRKEKLSIDPSKQAQVKRVESWAKLKDMVGSIENGKHQLPSTNALATEVVPENPSAAPVVSLKRAKTLKVILPLAIC